jgi:glycerophosphoryl diester phosphodiesterase
VHRYPEIVGHRGAPRERRENTLPAFERALALGADAVELDVHATRDGVVVVHHDPHLHSSAGDAGLAGRPLAELSRSELAGRAVAGDSPVPLLAEVLDLAAGRATVYVEIKAQGIERAVVETIGAGRAACAVHSFDHRIARRVRALAPVALPVGVLLVGRLIEPAAALRAAGARDLWQQWDEIDAELLADVHAAGGRVVAWTVNDLDAGRRLAEIGVDALCTDLPGAMRTALTEGLAAGGPNDG